jgi:hypothetical protein
VVTGAPGRLALGILAGFACREPPAPLVPLRRPSAPVELTGSYVRESDSAAIGGMRVELVCCLNRRRPRDTLGDFTSRVGAFRFHDVRPGHYLLRGLALGYRPRLDTIVIGTTPPPILQLVMEFHAMCLGSCPPDPWLMAAARARRNEWGCDTDEQNVRARRAEWIERLSSDSAVRGTLRITMTERDISRRVRWISTRSFCRRAAELFDTWGTITSLEFTLFRFDDLILMSPANASWVFLVLNKNFTVLADFSYLQE